MDSLTPYTPYPTPYPCPSPSPFSPVPQGPPSLPAFASTRPGAMPAGFGAPVPPTVPLPQTVTHAHPWLRLAPTHAQPPQPIAPEALAVLRLQAELVARLNETWHRAERTRGMYADAVARTRALLSMTRETGKLPDVAVRARAEQAEAALAQAEQQAQRAHDFFAGAQHALNLARDLLYPPAQTDPALATILAHLPAIPDAGGAGIAGGASRGFRDAR